MIVNTQTAYNPDGTLSQTRDMRGGITKYTYDADFPVPKITCVEDPMGFKRWTNYVKTPGAAYGKILSTVDARGSGPDDAAHMTSYEYDEKGNQTAVTDPMGNTTRYIYDSEGKLKESIDPTGYHAYYDIPSTTTEVKDALGRVISVTDKDGKTTSYEYDSDSNLIKTTDPNGAVSTSQYDVLGRQVVSSDFEGNITRYEYDVMGRTTKTTGPDGSSTRFEYDAKGRQTRTIYSDDTYTQTTFDIYGNTKTTRDRAGRITEFFYDRLNRTVKIKDPAGNFTYYQYDANGNRTAVRDPRSSGANDDTYKTSYTYDLNNRLTRIDYPDATFETTTYDPNGNTLTKTDQKGQTTTYQYDNNNRTTKIIHPDQTTTEYSYDAGGRLYSRKDADGSTVRYENQGGYSREYRVDSSGKKVYDYVWMSDSDNNRTHFLDCTDADSASLPAIYGLPQYDENFNKIGFIPTSTLGQHFVYGRENTDNRHYRDGEPTPIARFGSLKFGTNGIQYAPAPGVRITTNSFDPATGKSSLTDPFGKIYRFETDSDRSYTYYPNNTFTERIFDENGLLSITHKRMEPATPANPNGTETILESFTYAYNNATGNITRITTANGEYTDYTYDLLDRLTCEEKKTQAGQRIYKIEYLFDNNDAKNGNIHQVIVNETDTTTFAYNQMNQLTTITNPDTSTETLTYDDNGNLTQSVNNTTGEVITYTWDCFNRMTAATLPVGEVVECSYDGDGMMTELTSSGLERQFVQQNRFAARELLKNHQDKWEASAQHVVNGTMLSTRFSATSIDQSSKSDQIYYHTDHLGSARLITDENGNITDTTTTDAYGNPIPKNAKMLQEFNFVGTHGIRYVEKIKMHNMRARWYSNQFFRFASFDPVRDLNRYHYTSNNPINNIDPNGEKLIWVNGGIANIEKIWRSLRNVLRASQSSFVNNIFSDLERTDIPIYIAHEKSLKDMKNAYGTGFPIYSPSGCFQAAMIYILDDYLVDESQVAASIRLSDIEYLEYNRFAFALTLIHEMYHIWVRIAAEDNNRPKYFGGYFSGSDVIYNLLMNSLPIERQLYNNVFGSGMTTPSNLNDEWRAREVEYNVYAHWKQIDKLKTYFDSFGKGGYVYGLKYVKEWGLKAQSQQIAYLQGLYNSNWDASDNAPLPITTHSKVLHK